MFLPKPHDYKKANVTFTKLPPANWNEIMSEPKASEPIDRKMDDDEVIQEVDTYTGNSTMTRYPAKFGVGMKVGDAITTYPYAYEYRTTRPKPVSESAPSVNLAEHEREEFRKAIEELTKRCNELEKDCMEEIGNRDLAEGQLDRIASTILGEPIGWTYHYSKWCEAEDEVTRLKAERDHAQGPARRDDP